MNRHVVLGASLALGLWMCAAPAQENQENPSEQPAAIQDRNQDQDRPRDRGRDRGPGGFRGRGGPPGGGGFSPSSMIITLALNDEVAKALELSDEQKNYLELLRDQMRDEDREFFESAMQDGASREERFEKFRDYQAKRGVEVNKNMKEILGDEKLARLNQIRMQAFGAFALMAPDTAKEVEITDGQMDQIRSVLRETFLSMRDRFQGGFDREENREVFEEIRKEIDAKILAVLTDRQKERWNKLVGEPVVGVDLAKIRESMRPRGGPPGDRGPGGRGRGGNRPRGETNQPRT
jgi:hypothetical protein